MAWSLIRRELRINSGSVSCILPYVRRRLLDLGECYGGGMFESLRAFLASAFGRLLLWHLGSTDFFMEIK